MPYQPPYTISPTILNLIAEISEAVGRLTAVAQLDNALSLRRINRIRSIQGSLAIEGNTLSEAQITAILEGKRVIASPREVREVRNALQAYDYFERWQPARENDLLAAHRMLMAGLIDEAGSYRHSGVGVMAGEQVIHMAPGANQVPRLMTDLLTWLARSNVPPLISSAVFHYEFEFIHPFADGNGRMGRLWQTLILTRWNPLFANIPVESLVFQHQQAYYDALAESTRQTDSSPFIEFMLKRILEAVRAAELTDQASDQVGDQVSTQVARLLTIMHDKAEGSTVWSSKVLMQALGLSHQPTFRKNYLNSALAQAWIEQTQPDSPRSPTQGYRLTARGMSYVGKGLIVVKRIAT